LASADWSGRRVMGFCSAVPSAWKTACIRAAMETLVQVASPAQRAALCDSRRQEFVAICHGLTKPKRAT
jgi:hypothetical protein